MPVGVSAGGKSLQIGLSVANGKSITIDMSSHGKGGATVSIDTTANWNAKLGFVPQKGEIVVYSDHGILNPGTEDEVLVPAIKIGDGNAYLIDLPFVGDDVTAELVSLIEDHIRNTSIHVTPAEKAFWNDKLNYDVDDNTETLIFNRL